jgi:hypothetical protein
MLYWNTVTEPLKEVILKLMQAGEFKPFRLVGGTALSLQFGHRMSEDIDLFTDAPYSSLDFNVIETYLTSNFNCVEGELGGNPGVGKSYFVGSSPYSTIKLDLYYSMDPFSRSPCWQKGCEWRQ